MLSCWIMAGGDVFYFSGHWKYSADIFVSFCFYYQWSKKSANDAAHSGILWYLASCRTSESSQQKHYIVKAGLLGMIDSEIIVLQLMKGLISLDDEARWRPREPALAATLAQILKSACILDNSPVPKTEFKPSVLNMPIYLLLLPNL